MPRGIYDRKKLKKSKTFKKAASVAIKPEITLASLTPKDEACYPPTYGECIRGFLPEQVPWVEVCRKFGINPNGWVTQMLENCLTYLDCLRGSLESERRTNIRDVREYDGGSNPASYLLTGVPDTFDYSDLVDLIDELKSGLARRRVALEAA